MSRSKALTRGRRNKVLALFAENRLSEARQFCEQVLQADRLDTEMWVLLGTICRRSGDLGSALAACHHALQLNPGSAPAHSALGTCLQLQGQLADATASYRHAIHLQPDLVEPRYLLANLLRETGQMEEAIAAYRSVLDIQPDHIATLNNLGALLNLAGQSRDAITLFECALKQQPGSIELLANLGRAYLQHGRPDRAVDVFRRLVSINPGLSDAQAGLARALVNCGNLDEALAVSEQALRLCPDAVELLVQRARLLEVRGDYAEACALLEPLLESHPDAVAQTFFDLSKHIGRRDEAVRLLQRQLERPDMPATALSGLHFRLGKHHDEVREYELAFEHYRQANELCDIPFDPDSAGRQIDAIIGTYTAGFVTGMPHAGNRSHLPVFIVGMPRSGTTLVEQILASHSTVHGGGELIGIGEAVSGLSCQHRGADYPVFVPRVTMAQLDAQAGRYLGELQRIGAGALRVTDKMPHNFLYLGLIRQLFPEARIVHCVRNPLDTCLSCYFSHFGNLAHGYAYDLELLGRYYVRYHHLMLHWAGLFGDTILHVSYRDLITEQERSSRRLLEFCGLDWEDSCLAFHESKRVAYTLSYDQVRRPIYTESLGRWRNYRKHLTDLRRILDAADIEY